MDQDSVVIVFITCPQEDAEKIANSLVEKKLAACVNIIPEITSIYRWHGKVEKDTESLLIVKTTKKQFELVSSGVREIHPYTVPEIVSVEVKDGFDGYLRWVKENVGDNKEKPED